MRSGTIALIVWGVFWLLLAMFSIGDTHCLKPYVFGAGDGVRISGFFFFFAAAFYVLGRLDRRS